MPFKNVVGYGIGDFGLQLSLNSVGIWLLYFYTDVFGISPWDAGIIFLIARMWDAVNDPVMGYLADQTKSRWGKYRPYLLFGGIPLGIAFTLCFTTPDLGYSGKFAWALVTYLALNTFFTLVNIPYGALSVLITQDANERTRLSSSRMIFLVFAAAVVAIGTPELVKRFSSEQAGYATVTLCYAFLQVGALWVVFASTGERPVIERREKRSFRELSKVVTRNPPLLILCFSIFTGMCATTMRNASLMYYMEYYMGRKDLASVFLALLGVALIGGIISTTWVSKRIGKRNTFILGASTGLVFNSVLYFTPGDQIKWIFALCSGAAVGGGFILALMWSMVADTVEYAEWKTGMRGEGLIYGVYGFVQKFAMAIGGVVGGFYLGYVGYEPGAQQTPQALKGILNSFILFPLISTGLATVIIYFYKLDSDTFERIKREIEERKQI